MRKNYFLGRHSVTLLLLVFIFTLQSVNAQSENSEWVGKFEFFDGQTNSPRDRPSDFTIYTLTILEKDNSLIANFLADGTQISDEYECSVQILENSIKVFFGKDLNGMNESRFSPFKKGQLLFTLTKTRVGGKRKYLFRSGDYEILPLSTVSKNHIYFDKKSG